MQQKNTRERIPGVSREAKEIMAQAALTADPLLEAIVWLESKAFEKLYKASDIIPEMDEISDAKYDRLVAATYNNALADVRARLESEDDLRTE